MRTAGLIHCQSAQHINCKAQNKFTVAPTKLEKYLHEQIPMSKTMQVSVVEVKPEGVVLSAPLAPNVNHQETVFGGSASAVAILAAWSLLHTRLKSSNISSRLVIQRNTMDYERPISGTFTARSFILTEAVWEPFTRMLLRKGRARITVCCVLQYEGKWVAHLEGEFVALIV